MEQKLRVWWIPQLPGAAFQVEVKTLVEAKLLLNTLADYDRFQLDNKIKPDFTNTGGLDVETFIKIGHGFDGGKSAGELDWVKWEPNMTPEFEKAALRVAPELFPVESIDTLDLDQIREIQAIIDRLAIEPAKEKPKKLRTKAKVEKRFGVDFVSEGGALTLPVTEVSEDGSIQSGEHSRTHPDGWTIFGVIYEDYYTWVNEFVAKHPKLGEVWGNFEKTVYATSERAFKSFYKNHPPTPWDYGDI